jgi:hypothetical protein
MWFVKRGLLLRRFFLRISRKRKTAGWAGLSPSRFLVHRFSTAGGGWFARFKPGHILLSG